MGYPRVPIRYLWLPYDLKKVIKFIGGRFEPKKKNSKKILYVIPSALLLFLPDYCHSFRIFVILSGFLSFLPNIVIPSELLSLLPNSVIPSELLPFQIFVILNSSSTLLYRKGEKIGRQSRPYLQVSIRSPNPCLPRALTCQWQ